MNDYDELHTMFAKIVRMETRFSVPRIGEIVDVEDELGKGRVLVTIPMLGWNTNDTGAWCYPNDKKSLITPKVGDFVLVEFIDGDKDLPIYSGLSNQMKDMLPKNYDGKATSQVLFEDNNQEFFVKYDEKEKELYIEDSHGNKTTINTDGVLIEDTNGNTITMESGKVFINGNLEILQ